MLRLPLVAPIKGGGRPRFFFKIFFLKNPLAITPRLPMGEDEGNLS
jgi:hypothetical protein